MDTRLGHLKTNDTYEDMLCVVDEAGNEPIKVGLYVGKLGAHASEMPHIGMTEQVRRTRRVVAAWNATKGIPIEALEAGVVRELIAWARDSVAVFEGRGALNPTSYPNVLSLLGHDAPSHLRGDTDA